MHSLIYWFGFLGAWLLFAGPIHQASVELRAEGDINDRVRASMANVPQPEPVSAWWWLLPPVHWFLHARRTDDYHDAVLAALTPEEVEAATRFGNIARGWFFVGGGAWLIALKETWELVEHYEWPTTVYWVVVVLMSLVAIGITGASVSRERDLKDRATS